MPDLHVIDRRTVLRAAGVGGLVVGCGSALSACGGGAGSTSTGSGSAAAPVQVPVSKVPVGSGVILPDGGGIVVVQPTAGAFKAYSATCPHQGCTVASVDATTITCPCHGSQFKTSDGSVVHGPAQSGLTVLTATVQGSAVIVG